MKKVKVFLFLFIASGILSCEKNVTVKIPEAESKIVVEGKIETDTFPIVILSKTLPFFGEININEILNQTLTGAVVFVNDGFTTDTLKQIDPAYGIYFGMNMRGIAGRTYELTIQIEGKTLKAVTTIPQPLKLDSVWWKVNGNRDSLGFTWAHMTDPDTLGNCYKIFAQRINKYSYGEDAGRKKDSTFVAVAGSSFEDKFFNAKSFDFSFARGKFYSSAKEDDNNDEQFYWKKGDTIIVKFCSIDRATFEFWRTEDSQIQGNGNPFGSAAPITSNIDGGLGIWGGYAPTFDTIIAK
jgi:hypothetical protein